ncbi:Methyl-accepting chemotaxis protein I (serine chemoreceptor protein) [Rhodovulum sp. P5]|uniref:methyl-accepting chemotaxis protein n=1 Tax=Rhodovulum sp. P5 TaxID=1564506 RepID=UPI0009C1C0EE|nr:methyl-accepting chemotaxis protein [Rhodovulum sp. P5]ARE39375.1 Methyl-accepting chemotaxis protein I (serine chemoreceptor protein) [Rhodovulum sp. P5]
MFRKFTQMPISRRLPVMLVLILAFTTTAMGVTLYQLAQSMRIEAAQTMIKGLAEDQAARVEEWVHSKATHLAGKAATPLASKAVTTLDAAIAVDGGDLKAVQKAYVTDNPHPLGQRQALEDAGDGSAYSAAHAPVQRQLRSMLDNFGYYDIFLFNLKGDLIYTVVKEADFGENFATGKYADTGLGQVYREAAKAAKGSVAISDFAPYAPSADAPAGFMASPIFDSNGTRVGVMAFQLPIDMLADHINATAALGEKGDIYIAAVDGTARTASHFQGRFKIFDDLGFVPYVAAHDAGKTGFFSGDVGASGDKTLAYTREIEFDWADWMIVVELDQAETLADLAAFRHSVIGLVAGSLVLALVISIFASRGITRPLQSFLNSMQKVASGDYRADISVAERGDEIGSLGRMLVEYRDRLAETEELQAKRTRDMQAQESVTDKLAAAMAALSEGDLSRTLDDRFPYGFEPIRENFNKSVLNLREILASVVDNANEIHVRAEEIADSSDDLSRRTENQAATLEETAAALDELTSSVRASADGASQVESVAREARHNAEKSGEVVDKAVEAMSEIKRSSDGIVQIIGVIDDIAFQTNLLALNAGVEAARAGEAGRGFAVVASEVRALAQRSSEAAREIKQLISGSTDHVESGVELVNRTGEALTDIVKSVSNISDLISGITSGAQEQSIGLGEINVGVTELDKVTQQNAAMVEEATAAANTLKQEATNMKGLVSQFRLAGGAARAGTIATHRATSGPASPRALPQPQARAANGDGWRDF